MDYHKVSRKQLHGFSELISKNSGEREIDRYLKENLEVLACCLKYESTGHHGTYVIPQQSIKLPSKSNKGLKPDYLFAGDSSDGLAWFVLELKGAGERIFDERSGRLAFSNCANSGVFQLLDYIDYCTENQVFLQQTLGIKEFREPRGILLMGRSTEMEDSASRKRMKRAWNNLTSRKLQIRTYDSLLRGIDEIIRFKEAERNGTLRIVRTKPPSA